MLAETLVANRADRLATISAHERTWPTLKAPTRAELNPPLWELGQS